MPEQENTLSNQPQKIWLSGLNLGPGGGFSGQSQSGSLSGSPDAGRGLGGAMAGGPDLQQILEMLQLQNLQDAQGAPNTSSLLAAIGSLGLGGGALGQQGGFGQSQIAGQTQGGGTGGQNMTAGAGGGSTFDPFSLLAKSLGLVKTATGLASPTQDAGLGTEANISGITPEQQTAFQQQRAGERQATASPTLDSGAFPTGSEMDQLIAQANQGLAGAGELSNLARPGAAVGTGFSAGEIPTGGSIPSGLSGAPLTPSPTVGAGSGGGPVGGSALSAIQGGLGGTIGALNLAQALQAGNVPQGIGGGLQTIGGLAQLLQNSPQLARLFGLSDLTAAGSGLANTSLLSDVGAGAGGLGGLLGLAGGAQTLASGGSPVSAATQLGSGALSTYGALSTLFPDIFPSISSALSGALGIAPGAGGSILGGVGTGAASTAGAEAGTGAAGAGAAAGEGAATAAGDLGAGLAGGLAAAPLAAITLANTISGLMDTQHAAYGAQENFRKLTGDLPQAIQGLRDLPSAFNLLPQTGGTPEQAQAEIAAINKDIDPWLNSGLYDFTQSGQTSAGGGWSGQGAEIKFPQGPNIFNKIFSPAFNAAEQEMIRAYDVLGQGGQSATSQIPGFDPASITGLNFSPYNLALQEIQRLNPNYQLVPSPEAIAAAGPAPWQTPPPGFSFYGGRYVPTDVMSDLLGLQANGGLMSGIQNIVAKERSGGYAPLSSPDNVAVANAASQYNPSLAPTPEQLAAQYATPYQDLSSPQA